LAVGVGYEFTQIETIFPQPHDIRMDRIVTGTSAPIRDRPARDRFNARG
jgi:5-formyltetrahydrofolate cyclo-ligase